MNPPVFPTFADYQSALQHPEISFSSNFLSKGIVESDLWGFPRVRSGGFALTYKVELKDNIWAARCFHRAVRDRAIRYSQICETLEHLALPFFVPTRYFQRGIAVHGKQFPISIIEWIEGESLENYVFHHLDRPESLIALSERFRAICRRLEECGLAHGDLSHRNILIKNDEIFLIDYDGMYVPSLKGRKSSELGNIHFQHPLRSSQDFDAHIDRFSSIVIYLALLALAEDASLWKQFQSGGEGLLFQRSDFLNPDMSKLFRLLGRFSSTSRLIAIFKRICLSPVDTIPSLEELLTGDVSQVPIPIILPSVEKKKQGIDIPVLDSSWMPAILRSMGQIVTITGIIREVFHGLTETGANHVFLNYGDWKNDCFTAVLWGNVLDEIQRIAPDIDTWQGKQVSVTGLVTIRNRRPQIQVDSVTDLVLRKESGSQESRLFIPHVEKPSNRKKIKLEVIPEAEIIVPVNINSSTPVINLDDMFRAGGDHGVEDTLNQLYAKNRFKKKH